VDVLRNAYAEFHDPNCALGGRPSARRVSSTSRDGNSWAGRAFARRRDTCTGTQQAGHQADGRPAHILWPGPGSNRRPSAFRQRLERNLEWFKDVLEAEFMNQLSDNQHQLTEFMRLHELDHSRSTASMSAALAVIRRDMQMSREEMAKS
jgi:hypothetical protein